MGRFKRVKALDDAGIAKLLVEVGTVIARAYDPGRSTSTVSRYLSFLATEGEQKEGAATLCSVYQALDDAGVPVEDLKRWMPELAEWWDYVAYLRDDLKAKEGA